MPEHKYISERFERKTYLKGSFRGKFIGELDRGKSDGRYERFFDLEILEGEISTSQDKLLPWSGGEPEEFDKASRFITRLPGEMCVSLTYIDGSVKHFKVRMQELKLIRCRLSKQVYNGSQVNGFIEGEVTGYLLHHDTSVKESEDCEYRPIGDFNPPAGGVGNDTQPPLPPPPPVSVPPPFNYKGCLSLVAVLIAVMLVIVKPQLLLSFLFFAVGGIGIYRFNRWLTRRYTLGRWYRAGIVVLAILFVGALGYSTNLYLENKKGDALVKVPERERLRLDSIQKTNSIQRRDSFEHHLGAAKKQMKKKETSQALKSLDRAAAFASPENSSLLKDEKTSVLTQQAEQSVKNEEYGGAANAYTKLIGLSPSSPEYYYKRALAYIQTDKIKEAVSDLKRAMELGDKPAMLLHEKINPLKRRVTGYVTRCCDGTASNAKGRGACSHHGGVCDWNDEVYEEYREY